MLSRNRNQTANFRLETYATMINQILVSMGINPDQASILMEEGFGWNFRRGSAIIELYISQENGMAFFQALSPIMHLPQTGLLPLYRRLLEMNLNIPNRSLGIHLDVVYVFSERPLEGMDAIEANSIILSVAELADDLDDKLVAEFGGRLYSRV